MLRKVVCSSKYKSLWGQLCCEILTLSCSLTNWMLYMLDCDFYVIHYWALPKRATQARSLVGLLPAGGATGLRCCVDSLSGWKRLGVLPKELGGQGGRGLGIPKSFSHMTLYFSRFFIFAYKRTCKVQTLITLSNWTKPRSLGDFSCWFSLKKIWLKQQLHR